MNSNKKVEKVYEKLEQVKEKIEREIVNSNCFHLQFGTDIPEIFF